jgi:hypothetical protein
MQAVGIKKKQKGKKIPSMVVTPYEPSAKKEKPKKLKPLSPEMAERMIRSLTRLYNENMEITDAVFERIKRGIIRRVVAL